MTLTITKFDLPRALDLMSRAMGSQAEVSAAAYLPEYGGSALVALRVQGFPASVAARCRMLGMLIGAGAEVDTLEGGDCERFWAEVATAVPLGSDRPLWRISVAPSRALALVEAIPAGDKDWLFDWAGGLAWLAFEGDADVIRSAARALGGHAMLVRAPATTRARVPALHPQPVGLSQLEERVRRAFDPAGLFETGRF